MSSTNPIPSSRNEPKKVCCGDTEFCAECLSHQQHPNTFGDEKIFTLNALGRCDFYQGPSSVRVAV